MDSETNKITTAQLSRLLPSDLERISLMMKSDESKDFLLSLIRAHLIRFRNPTANDLAHILKLTSQLNVANVWNSVDPVAFLNSLRDEMVESAFDALREALDVAPSEIREREGVGVVLRKDQTEPLLAALVEPLRGKLIRGKLKGRSPKFFFRLDRNLAPDSPAKTKPDSSSDSVPADRTVTIRTGRVKWFSSAKGYGFISPEDGGKDVFVNIQVLERSGIEKLVGDQMVGFEVDGDRVSKIVDTPRPIEQ